MEEDHQKQSAVADIAVEMDANHTLVDPAAVEEDTSVETIEHVQNIHTLHFLAALTSSFVDDHTDSMDCNLVDSAALDVVEDVAVGKKEDTSAAVHHFRCLQIQTN